MVRGAHGARRARAHRRTARATTAVAGRGVHARCDGARSRCGRIENPRRGARARARRGGRMNRVGLTVNGVRVEREVEPRTQLADFLREHLLLTGTHIGCEHGICGACTVVIDGEIARSCITYAVACDGAFVRTIEDFDDDLLMVRLRDAFRREHALQCGYCTPGMLIAARDLVKRLPRPDENRIRVELAGNLCRCTGYRGIVAAVRSVAETQEGAPATIEPQRRAAAGSFQ